MDRRAYIKQLALVTGGALVLPRIIVSCGVNPQNVNVSSSLEPFRTLEEIRFFVQQSKGHLKQEVQRLVKQKDPEAIFNFINQRIATIPAHPESITSNAYETRWGRNGILRCGKGTLREKSDLLFFMLKEAGFSPEYFRTSFVMSSQSVNKVFCGNWKENNEIEVSEDYINKWDKTLSATDKVKVPKEVDLSQEKSKKLAQELLSKLPEDFTKDMPNIDWLDVDSIEAPLVRVKIDGQIKDLNFVEDKSFSEFKESTLSLFELSENDVNKKTGKVRLIIRSTFSDDPNKELEIIRGEWELEDLIGNQVALQCMSTLPQEQLLQTPIKDVQQFVPVLALQNPSLSDEEKMNRSFKGVGFDLMGNTFEEDGSGAIRMNGLALNEGSNDTSQVRSLKVELLESEYPTIKLRCAPLDANGKPVLGLSGSTFKITDQQQTQFPVVLQNTLTARILIYFDATTSMPYPYAAGTIPDEIRDQLKAFEEIYPSVVFETKSYQLDFLDGLKLVDLGGYDHVLCLGDGEAFEDVTSEDLKNVVGDNSISYHFVKNGFSTQTETQVINCFQGAGFPYLRIENLESDIRSLGTQLKEKTPFPYLLSYEAPLEGDDLIHPVTIEVANNSSVQPVKKRYVMDRERKYDEGKYPCGISITLEWNEDYSYKSITKHVAGFNPKKEKIVTNKHKEEVRSFALGTHRFFFEADKATLPVLLDQSISSQLSVAPFFEDPKETTKEEIEQINQFEVLPVAGLSIFAPLPTPSRDVITFENNFQTSFYSEFVNFDEHTIIKKIDVWETSDVRTLAPSKQQVFERNLEATALLALSEASLFGDSTFDQLNQMSISNYSNGAIDFQNHPKFSVFDNETYSNYFLYDQSLTSQAYWKINKKSGALIGILPDGSGGGIEETIAFNLKLTDKYAAAYNKAAAPLMSDPLAFGTVTLYGQFLARLYGLVCVAVVSMDAAELPVKSRQALKKLAYGVIKSFAFAKFSKLKNFEKILDKLFDPGWPEFDK